MKKLSIFLMLLMAMFAPLAMNGQNSSTLTVYGDNTTTNEYVPIYGYWADSKSKCEFIIPSEKIAAMNGGRISAMKFYLSSSDSNAQISTTFNVFVKEVSASTLTAYTGNSDATTVFNSTITIAASASNVELDIPFTSDYVYTGGNLLVGFYQTGSASYNHTYWTGETQSTNTAWSGYGSSAGSGQKFLPKTTFTYEVSTTPDIILPATATVMTGFTTTLTASTFNVTGTPSITYASSNQSIATVTGSGTTATVTGVSAGTATITATMTYNGNTYTSTCAVTVEDPSYCTPGTGNYDNDGISNVTFGTNGVVVNNTVSGINYGDYSNLVGAVEAGTTGFEVAITYKTGYTYGTIIWVDWNKNYTFEGATEVVYAGQSGDSSPTTLTATFDIPSTAEGDYRMRIIGADMALDSYTGSLSAAANADPCGSYNYSTCHDYTLNVFAASTDPSITLTPATATVYIDDTETLTAIVRNVTNPTITYTSSDTSVATVSSNGTTATVTGVAVGTATITASMTVDGTTYTATSTITVQLDPCAKVIPYTYGFEDATDFSCWTTENCEECSSNGSLYGRYSSSSYARTGSYSFVFSSYCGEEDPQYLISPVLSGVQNGVHVEFYYKIVDFTDTPETFEVGYSTTDNNVSSFTWVDSKTTNSQTYEHFSANYMGNVRYIAVKYTSSDSYYIIVDDFTIEEAPNCLEPTNVLASNETTTSATISWTAGGSETEWDIYFTTNPSDVPTASTTPSFSGLTTNSFNTIDNNYTLTPATTYYVYVRSACSSTETSGWSNPGIFNTECYEMNLPFSYGFEDGGLSVCWTIINESPVYMSTSVASTNSYEGTYHLFLDRRTTQSSNQIVVLPEVSSNYALNNCEVSFYAMLSGGSNYYNSGRTLTVGVMTDPYDVSTFVAVGSAVEPTTSYAQYTFDLSSYTGNGHYIAIKHDASSNGYTYIDNLEVTYNAYTLTINGYTSAANGWNLIASPVATSPDAVENMISNTYDLYRYNATAQMEWENYQQHQGDFDIVPGQGYLYANSETVELGFSGDLYDGNGEITLENAGWNLVGNPFYDAIASIGRDYYRMNSDHDGLIAGTVDETINAWEGIFVEAENPGEVLTFTPVFKGEKSTNSAMVINLSQNSVIDRAIVRFGGNSMTKFQLFENSTKLYIAQDGEDYAIVNSGNEGEMPVNFKAEKNGTYTISVNTENVSMDYLHLIDNMTGNDVDLLANPSYTFNASTTDYASRFRLVFAAAEVEIFAYYNGSEWVVNGNGTMQLVDMMGRVLSSENVNGIATVNTNKLSAGVYVMRLVNGNDVKTQKIVVK